MKPKAAQGLLWGAGVRRASGEQETDALGPVWPTGAQRCPGTPRLQAAAQPALPLLPKGGFDEGSLWETPACLPRRGHDQRLVSPRSSHSLREGPAQDPAASASSGARASPRTAETQEAGKQGLRCSSPAQAGTPCAACRPLL